MKLLSDICIVIFYEGGDEKIFWFKLIQCVIEKLDLTQLELNQWPSTLLQHDDKQKRLNGPIQPCNT
jgi:hypothetical protein